MGPCENRTGGTGTFTIGDTRISLDDEIGRGMGQMLVSPLANTGRFAVVEANPEVIAALERQRAIRGDPEAGPGLASAELMVTCGVTEFEPDASGIGGGAANVFGRTLGAAIAGTSTSRVGIDIRLVDVDSGLNLSAFTVRGEARNFTLGGLTARRFGPPADPGARDRDQTRLPVLLYRGKDEDQDTDLEFDLLTVPVVPLHLALSSADRPVEELMGDGVTLLEALRRTAEQVTVFCEGSRTKVQEVPHTLFPLLERVVVEARAPAERGGNALILRTSRFYV